MSHGYFWTRRCTGELNAFKVAAKKKQSVSLFDKIMGEPRHTSGVGWYCLPLTNSALMNSSLDGGAVDTKKWFL